MSYQKRCWQGPIHNSFYWYENDKDLYRCGFVAHDSYMAEVVSDTCRLSNQITGQTEIPLSHTAYRVCKEYGTLLGPDFIEKNKPWLSSWSTKNHRSKFIVSFARWRCPLAHRKYGHIGSLYTTDFWWIIQDPKRPSLSHFKSTSQKDLSRNLIWRVDNDKRQRVTQCLCRQSCMPVHCGPQTINTFFNLYI